MKFQKIKNLFTYKSFLSRAWFLLFFIAVFLTIVSFVKWIQILIFIPAFVLSIFFYSLFELYKIKRNFSYNFFKDKNWNFVKVFLRKREKYNFILAKKFTNWKIDFLESNNKLSYNIEKTTDYSLILYVFWSFDIFRVTYDLWKIKFNEDISSYHFYVSEKYADWEELSKLDNLKTSVNNIPYIKKRYNLSLNKNNEINFKIVSNEILKKIWDEKIMISHFFLVLLWSIWIIIEWSDFVLNIVLLLSYAVIFSLRNKKWRFKAIQKNAMLLSSFWLMLILTFINKDMSWPGSVFLIQILLIIYLFPKDFKNSFLFIFLVLFVFVAISLFSNQIRFILLFLLYISLSIYLLFFISWIESFDDKRYKIWNNISKYIFLKTFLSVIVLMFLFFMILPHWNKAENRTNIWNRQNEWTVSWFNEEISLENINNIKEDSRKVIVIENIKEEDINKLSLWYFRWKRYNYFDWKKWNSNFPSDLFYFKNITKSNSIELNIKYYLNWSKYLFLPASPLSIKNTDIIFWNSYKDYTVLKTQLWINEPTLLNISFKLWAKWFLVDREKNQLIVSNKIAPNIEDIITNFAKSIPEEYTKTPQNISRYIKDLAWFTYSLDDISYDLSDFLYWKKKWHCEYFATTLVLVLQYFWYAPTLVNGYSYWEYNGLASSYIVRANNAHTWVELYNEDLEIWDILDPTPSTISESLEDKSYIFKTIIDVYDYVDIKWYTYIVNFTWREQKKLYSYILNNTWVILLFWMILFIIFSLFKISFLIFKFFSLSKKEKILFIISKKYKKSNNALVELEKIDIIFSKNVRDYVYWDIWNITYYNLIKLLFIKRK